MARKSVGVSFDSDTISKIDSVRGLVPRSRFMEKIVLEALKNGGLSGDSAS